MSLIATTFNHEEFGVSSCEAGRFVHSESKPDRNVYWREHTKEYKAIKHTLELRGAYREDHEFIAAVEAGMTTTMEICLRFGLTQNAVNKRMRALYRRGALTRRLCRDKTAPTYVYGFKP